MFVVPGNAMPLGPCRRVDSAPEARMGFIGNNKRVALQPFYFFIFSVVLYYNVKNGGSDYFFSLFNENMRTKLLT